MPAIDFHAHVLPEHDSISRYLQTMDRAGIDQAVVLGGGLLPGKEISRRLSIGLQKIPQTDVSFDNEALLKIVQASRPSADRLLPFFFANPHEAPTTYQSVGHRFAGLKLAPVIHGVPFADTRINDYIDFAQLFGHPVYTHILPQHGMTALDLRGLARRYPDVTFVLGHGGTHPLDLHSIDTIAGTLNISWETSGCYKASLLYALETLGADRILFGSEYPLQDVVTEKQKIENVGSSAAEIAAILYENAAKLLKNTATLHQQEAQHDLHA